MVYFKFRKKWHHFSIGDRWWPDDEITKEEARGLEKKYKRRGERLFHAKEGGKVYFFVKKVRVRGAKRYKYREMPQL